MPGRPQPENWSPLLSQPDARGSDRQPSASPDPTAIRALGEPELEAALQLLVERAQYITGATGAALALPYCDEMVCRASAGECAPGVGVRLQVRSGLTGESITRRQLLRCDNAETDPRVNLETCRALGIASIVVLPLLRPDGEIRGLFELFSDHPYAFEERDLVALERMAGLTSTALDLAEQRLGSVPPPPAPRDDTHVESRPASVINPVETTIPKPAPAAIPENAAAMPLPPRPAVPQVVAFDPSVVAETAEADESAPPVLPEAMLRVRKCESCGFPVSEGRTLCLDCEKKRGPKAPASAAEPSPALTPAEDLPAFLANAVPVKESWLSNHVNLLAIIVFIVGVVVAVVVFR